MSNQTEIDIVDALRAVMKRRKIKLVDIASDIGIPYRNLQNYMYKKAKIPLDVYINICNRIGITADYPAHGKFKISTHDMQEAVIIVLGSELLNSIEFDEHLRWTIGPRRELDGSRVRRTAMVFATLFGGAYDRIRESRLSIEEDNG